MTSINVNFCKEGFNPSYVMTESCYKDSSSDKNVIVESRYGEKVMAETAVREDDVGMDLTDSLQKEGKEVI
jgi:hypothetical protein